MLRESVRYFVSLLFFSQLQNSAPGFLFGTDHLKYDFQLSEIKKKAASGTIYYCQRVGVVYLSGGRKVAGVIHKKSS